ncbi:bifunctional UDP-N-acetylglucosamine diphosphorylase/glucosamine-1-phosphate N-acetyltransferase GlmU [Hutsoniella sourekii]
MTQRMAVVLAAGKGTRMKSDLHKVLHQVAGQPMIDHVIRALEACQMDQIVTIIGHDGDQVSQAIGERSEFVWQEEQLGTGHAVLQAKSVLEGKKGATLVIAGDTPLISPETLEAVFNYHQSQDAKATILTALATNPTGYGRVVRSEDGLVSHIVEQKDANPEELMVKEINTGTYVFDNELLFEMLEKVTNDNAQGEYYLPDVIGLLKEAGETVSAFMMENMDEAIGINDRVALAEANRLMRERITRQHMMTGVTFINPSSVEIGIDVHIGPDTVIGPGVQLVGQTSIGSHSYIGSNSVIVDSQLADHVEVHQSVIEESTVDSYSDIGPMAHLRPNSHLGQHIHIGNFVEVKNSRIGNYTKAGHLSYIGDASLGESINIGCGTTFVNFDGKNKFRTTVGDEAFIGSGTNLIAPLKVGRRAIVAAGSTITDDVESESLAIAREKQASISNYWDRFMSDNK